MFSCARLAVEQVTRWEGTSKPLRPVPVVEHDNDEFEDLEETEYVYVSLEDDGEKMTWMRLMDTTNTPYQVAIRLRRASYRDAAA
jgi:hypothetical protein